MNHHRPFVACFYRCLLPLLAGAFLLAVAGCNRREESPPPEAPSEAAINSRSQENILEETLRKVKADPGNADLLYHLADLYDRNAQYEKAVENYAKVVAIDPNMGYAYFKMGTAYSRMNQMEKAVAVLRQAAVHLPGNPVVLNNLGIACGKLNRWDDEVKALKKAIALRPHYAAARFNLGMAYLRKNKLAEARSQYEALKEFDLTMADELLKRLDAGK